MFFKFINEGEGGNFDSGYYYRIIIFIYQSLSNKYYKCLNKVVWIEYIKQLIIL